MVRCRRRATPTSPRILSALQWLGGLNVREVACVDLFGDQKLIDLVPRHLSNAPQAREGPIKINIPTTRQLAQTWRVASAQLGSAMLHVSSSLEDTPERPVAGIACHHVNSDWFLRINMATERAQC